MHQSLSPEIIINHTRRRANGPRSKVRSKHLETIHQVKRDQLARPDTQIILHPVRIPAYKPVEVAVLYIPTLAGPHGCLIWEFLRCLFETVPEGAFVGFGVGLVFFCGAAQVIEAADVFADVEFCVEVGEGGCCAG